MLPAAKAPLVDVVKFTVHVAVCPCVDGDGAKEIPVGDVAAVIVTADAGLVATVSSDVATLNLLAA